MTDGIVKRHAMKNKGPKEKTKILKDAVVKRHAAKNVGSRGKTKILKDAVMKRHATKNVSLRRKIKIYTIIIKTKILSNTQGVLEISKVMIV